MPRRYKSNWSPPPQQLRRLEALLRQPQRDLNWYHRVGEMVVELVPVERTGRYGEGRIQLLAERVQPLLANAVNIFRRARWFAIAYKRSELKRLVGLDWSHVALLSAVPDAKTRRRLERATKQKQLSYSDLKARFQELYGRRPAGGSQPKPISDAGPLSAVRGINRASATWLHSFEARVRSSKSPLHRAGRKKPTVELQTLLHDTVAQLEELDRAVSASRKTLEQLRRRVDSRLRANAGRGGRASTSTRTGPRRR